MPRKSSVLSVTKDVRKVVKSPISNKKSNKSTKDEKKLVKNIYIGANNAVKWNTLKNKLNYESDVDLVRYLLELADPLTNGTEERPAKPVTPEQTPPVAAVEEEVKPPGGEPEERREEKPREEQPADSNDSAPAVPSPEEDDLDADWQPGLETDTPLRRSPRKGRGGPKIRRSARNHRHHRKRRHRRSSAHKAEPEEEAPPPESPPEPPVEDKQPESQQVLREDNHKHHHEKHKSSVSRGRKKRKHKDKGAAEPRPEKVRAQEEVPSPPAEVTPPPPPRAKTPEPPEEPSPPTPPPQEKHRKKHKRRESKKRSHDIRRAPTDGIPVVERPPSPPPAPNGLQPPLLELPPDPEPPTSMGVAELRMNGVGGLPPPRLSPIPELPRSHHAGPVEVEPLPQRVAIRIKLCGDCGCRHVQDACPLLRPATQVPDAMTRSQWSSSAKKGGSFSNESLPIHLLSLEERDSSHGLSVVASAPIARYTQFGPLLGERIKEMDIPDDFNMRDIWEVCSSSERFYLSTLDSGRANWLRFIRPAPNKEQRNVAAIARGSELFFVSMCNIEPGTELLFWLEYSTSGWARKKMEKTNCGGCNLRFAHSLYYRLHCSVFHDPNFSLTIRKYHCKVCGLAVLGKENIMRHAAEQHAGKGAYQCQFCKKFFLRLNYLEMHRTYGCAANPQRTRPLCDFCGRKFCQPQKLKVHIKRMHSDMAEVLREFQCKMCLKLLGSRAALQRHLKEVHHKDLVGACTCDRCGKMFQNKSNLKIHMLTHSGVKPFRCKEGSCSAAFTTKQCLQFHYKKVHGFSEDSMPKIERCVAYTFDAYAGGAHDEEGAMSGSPPFTPAGTEDSGAASPTPSLPSLDEDEEDEEDEEEGEELSHCSSNMQPLQDTPENMECSVSSVQPPASSPTPPPPTLRQVSPPASPTCRPGGSILSKASKKWMGDVLPPSMVVDERMPSPVDLGKRWPPEPPEHRMEHRLESPDAEKKWAMECLPGMRSPEMMRRPEISFARGLREQDLEQVRRSPSPMGGEFSPLRRSEPSASLLVEAALDAAERDLSGKLADLKPLVHDNNPGSFLPRMNGLHSDNMNEADYSLMSTCAKPPRLSGIPETGLDMSYKQYDSDLVGNNSDINTEFRVVLRSPEHQINFEQEQGLDMSRSSGYTGAGSPYARYSHTDLLPPHLHPHHRAAVAAAGLMYEMEPANVRCSSSPPASPPPPTSYQAELLRHHWHHLPPTTHHTLDLSTARQQPSPEQSMSPMSPPPPTVYQNYPLSPSPYHAPPPPPRATTPTYHHYSGYY